MLTLQQGNVKISEKLMKILDGENLHIFWTTWEIYWRDVTYDNIKSHKKTGLHSLSLFSLSLSLEDMFLKTIGAKDGTQHRYCSSEKLVLKIFQYWFWIFDHAEKKSWLER